MSQFTIAVQTAQGEPVLIPATLKAQPDSWSAVAGGGMWDASIVVEGSAEELAGLSGWLGHTLDILDEQGTAVWWGDVAAVEVVIDGARGGVSLEYMANRVQVRYARRQPGGGVISADTAWADNTLSQQKYGIWERRISATRPMLESEANAYRDIALAKLAEPSYTLKTDTGRSGGVVYCTGFWQRTRRVYYRQPAGLVQHGAQGETVPLGLGFTSNKVAFVAREKEIHSIDGLFKNFENAMRVRVSGAGNATNNSTTRTVLIGGDGRDPKVYTSTGVTFSPNDDVADANAGLSFLAQDDVFTITGTNDNNGTHLVDKEGAKAIEVSAGYHGGLVVDESAGDTVVFSRGNKIGVDGSVVDEHTGQSVTVAVWGQKHYQPFVLPSNDFWTVAVVEIKLRKVGAPSDGVILQLVADSSGVPGSVLDSATVAAASCPVESTWISFTLGNTVSLNPANTYGLTVARTGANDAFNYYEIEVDPDAGYTGGSLRQWEGATWQTPNPALDLIFRVLGSVDTGLQTQMVLSAVGWPVYQISS